MTGERPVSYPTYTPQPPLPVPYRTKGPSTNGLAIASMVLGIVWLYGLGSLLAVIFAAVAKSQIKASGGTQKGDGMATAGLVLGIVGLVAVAFIFLMIIAVSVST